MNYFDKETNKFIMDTTLPHNFLAEKMILSCILLNSQTIELIRQNLTSKTFYFKNHQRLYDTLLLMNDNNIPIDIVTLTTFVQDKGLLSEIGGIKVILDLANQRPTFAYILEYIRIVKEKFLKRCLIRLGYQVVNYGYITNQSFETTLLNIENELFALTNEISSKENLNTAQVLNDVFLELKSKFLNPQLPGLSSGFKELDKIIQGFQKSDLIILAGRPSMGKTAFSLNLALNCIKYSELPVLFCSLEMSKQQIIYRLLSTETGINQMKLRSGQLSQNDWIKLNKIMRVIAKLPFFIDDNSSLSISEIRSQIKTILFEQSQIGMVIIDYLQLMQNPDFKQGTRVQELAQITRSLKQLAREFNTPIIALSQLSRNVDNRMNQRPILSDLRESGSIEQDADLVLMLYRSNGTLTPIDPLNSNNNMTRITELIIAKHRNGPLGTIKLEFNENRMQFNEPKL